jgi:hypothetical protein
MDNARNIRIESAEGQNIETFSEPGPTAAVDLRLSDLALLADAQNKARKWADKAIDLCQAGDPERARYASGHATAWLGRMHAIETRIAEEKRSAAETAMPRYGTPRRKRKAGTQSGDPGRYRSHRAGAGSSVTNDALLLAWQRSSA